MNITSSSPSPVFVGCGFSAKYPLGGGNFSVPLQYVLGLKRLGRPAIWLETMPKSGDPATDAHRIKVFSRRMKQYDIDYSLLLHEKQVAGHLEVHDLDHVTSYGMEISRLRELVKRGTLLNLSYSIKPPLTNLFERRLLCSLDPTEVLYWMDQLEMGQSSHDEFWSVGLCMDKIDPRLPKPIVPWKPFFPLVDTEFLQMQPQPVFKKRPRFTTVGQWYWDGNIEIDGEYIDFSKQAAFEPYLELPRRVPEAIFELAINLATDDGEQKRLRKLGWHVVSPHRLMPTPYRYYNYLAGSFGEFTAVKLESKMQSGWLSDRAAAYLSMGRPVITEPTGAENFLPEESGLFFVNNISEAVDTSKKVLADWKTISHQARATAIEYFDAAKTLRKMLDN